MSRAQLPYSLAVFHQIRQKPYPLQTDFKNVPDSGSGMSRAQLSLFPGRFSPKFDRNPSLYLPILNMYLIQVQTCSKHNFHIPRSIAINSTLPAKQGRNRLVPYTYMPTEVHAFSRQHTRMGSTQSMDTFSGSCVDGE